ncbi:hypothetical protein QO207_24155 [Pseudomonas sp. CAN2814]|jgi:hypothetical protein|uniref:hypothetical protein n=1 Tax=Pseudomonas sp. CAN1 TaxID=3046726 RepID=UPI002648BD5D|nr:hypothetical protein [Pseudomonas sp. CAN1]MDN6859691.1 hypothetical protein [Pseudomonas sp. CAN1]
MRSHNVPRHLIPDTPAKLSGSFDYGLGRPDYEQVMNDFLGRVERETEQSKRVLQAQRAIGALMALKAAQVGKAGFCLFQKDVFRRLAELTAVTPNDLVAMAGVSV